MLINIDHLHDWLTVDRGAGITRCLYGCVGPDNRRFRHECTFCTTASRDRSHLVPGPLLVAHLALTLLMSSAETRHTESGVLLTAVAGAIPGVIAGAWLLTVSSTGQLTFAALVVLVIAVAAVLADVQIGRSRRSIFGAGIVSGGLGTTISVNGPPLAIAMIHLPGPARRGTLATYLVVVTAFSLVALAVTGNMSPSTLLSRAYLVLPTLVGYYTARRIRHRVDRIDARAVVLPLAALSIIITALSGLHIL